jgi:hypothetical protein
MWRTKLLAVTLLSLFAGCEASDPRIASDPLVQCMTQLKAHAADLAPEKASPEELRPLRMMFALGTAGARRLARDHYAGTGNDQKYDEFLHECQDIEESLGIRS